MSHGTRLFDLGAQGELRAEGARARAELGELRDVEVGAEAEEGADEQGEDRNAHDEEGEGRRGVALAQQARRRVGIVVAAVVRDVAQLAVGADQPLLTRAQMF